MHVSPQISKILVSSSDIVLENLKDIKSEIAQLKLNSIVDAKVAKILTGDRAALTINGQNVVAKTHALLTEGETIQLKVVADGDTKILKLVPKSSELQIPRGLKETAAFGRSGLYARLTGILDEYLPQSSKQINDAVTNKESPVARQNESPAMKNAKMIQTAGVSPKETQLLEIKSADVAALKRLVSNKNIPWAQKAATLLLSSDIKQNPEPSKMLMGFAEKLVKSAVKEPVQLTEKPVLVQLEAMNEKMAATLQPNDKDLLSTVAKDQRLPWEYKLLTVLSSGEKNTIPAAELAPLSKFLANRLTEGGYKIPAELLPADISAVNEGLPESAGIHTAKKLKTLLDAIAIMQDREPDDEVLKKMVLSSGLVWEKKLSQLLSSIKESMTPKEVEAFVNGDIKALAMKFVEAIAHEDKSSANILRSFVDGLEKMQLLNTYSADESGRYLLPLPFFLNDTLKFGQLLVDLDKGGGSKRKVGEKAIRVAFILELSRLGHLKADFSMYKKSISGEFGVENEEIQSLFHQLIPGLIKSLEEKAYEVKRIGCSVISSGELAGMSLTDMVTDNPDGILNIVV